MVNYSIKSEIIFDLINGLSENLSEDEIVKKNVPTYMRKLNCFMACLLKKDGEVRERKFILPKVFVFDQNWLSIRDRFVKIRTSNTVDPLIEIIEGGSFYYAYKLQDYGCLILGRKTPLDRTLKNEIIPLMNFLGRNLVQAVEQEQKNIQDQIISHERNLFRTIIDNIPIQIYAKDIQGNRTIANKAELEFLNLTEESQVIGKSDFAIHQESVARDYDAQDRAVLNNGKHINNLETMLTCPELRTKWALVSKIPLKDESEIVNGMVGITIDITEQKLGEIAISKNNNKLNLLQNLIDNSSDAIETYRKDGSLIFANKVARKWLQIGDSSDYNITDFESVKMDEESWIEMLDKLQNVEEYTYEKYFVNKDTKEKFPVEVTAKFVRIGENGYVVANMRNITDRKRNELKLKKQQAKYRNIISNMKLGILELDTNNTIRFCNHSFNDISGYNCENMYKKNISEFSFGTTILDLINSSTDVERNIEVLVNNKNNEERWWLVSFTNNYNTKGDYYGKIGIFLDVTEKKQLESEIGNALEFAKEASKAKEMFLANMSHEIRTPLNGIIGMIRQLKKEDLSKTQNQFVENTDRASQHLLSVVNNILDITKIESGEMNIDNISFSMSELLGDVSSILSFHAENKNIKFEFDIDPNVADILKGDKARIRQILINVTGNAIKFTYYGKVRIECKSILNIDNCQQIEFKIIDTGIGMEEEYVKKVFDKFQQEDSSISRNFGGSGLGLFITKQLVDLMKGDIDVKTSKGKGTEFTIVLPLNIDQSAEENTTSFKISDHYNNNKLNILLVEDNQMNRMVAINTLELIAHNIDEADNGRKAVDLVRKNNYDLILMDIQMPVMNGMEATNIIRNELKDKTPIIALSANAFKSEIDACLQLGMNDYITKPFDEESLLQSIHNHNIKNNTMNNNDKKPEEMQDDNAKKYDLSKLEAMARGNDNFIKKMLALFVESFPPYINEMNEAMNNGSDEDIITVKKLAHKIKPSLSDMGIMSIIQDVKDIEAFDAEKGATMELSQKVENVSKVLSQVIDQIKNNEI